METSWEYTTDARPRINLEHINIHHIVVTKLIHFQDATHSCYSLGSIQMDFLAFNFVPVTIKIIVPFTVSVMLINLAFGAL